MCHLAFRLRKLPAGWRSWAERTALAQGSSPGSRIATLCHAPEFNAKGQENPDRAERMPDGWRRHCARGQAEGGHDDKPGEDQGRQGLNGWEGQVSE